MGMPPGSEIAQIMAQNAGFRPSEAHPGPTFGRILTNTYICTDRKTPILAIPGEGVSLYAGVGVRPTRNLAVRVTTRFL